MNASTKPLPPHGTVARAHHCSCESCRERMYRYHKAWRAARHRGEPSALVDSAPALDYVRNHLLPAAWTRPQIERAAGLAHDYLAVLLRDLPPRVYRTTADAILSLGPADRFRNLPDRALVDATGTHRRLQALAVKGHRIAETLERFGCHHGVMRSDFVFAASARSVCDAYNQLWRTNGPSPIGATKALRRGWVGPGAWDDDTIDDPRAVPNVGEDSQRGRSAAELLAESAVAAYSTDDQETIAARLGVTVHSLKRAGERAKSRAKAGVA